MKYIFTIFLSALITICGFGQSKFSIFKVSSGPWDPYERDYRITDNYVSMTGEINGQVVRITDRASSTYFLSNHEVSRDDYEMRMDAWDATDEKGRNCRILLGKNRRGPEKTLTVVYEDYVFNYFIYY